MHLHLFSHAVCWDSGHGDTQWTKAIHLLLLWRSIISPAGGRQNLRLEQVGLSRRRQMAVV